jgi:hypothetical protein
MNLGLPPPRRLPKPSPRSDKEFKDGFINDALPLYFASAEAAQKARHLFSESTYHVRALKYDDNVPEFTPNWLALIRAPTAIFEGDLDVITTPLEARRLHHGIAHSTIHNKGCWTFSMALTAGKIL